MWREPGRSLRSARCYLRSEKPRRSDMAFSSAPRRHLRSSRESRRRRHLRLVEPCDLVAVVLGSSSSVSLILFCAHIDASCLNAISDHLEIKWNRFIPNW
ncbi:hypothetical protein MRB53_025835 [Persea americana]|uniref:Uncharacterized protein n=1 Tax=Persea americana TaxID=3435 RepID=A0ACC2LGF4_PERAE|nr:hypothetical protein MRB53_025835 [Persea americana]